MLLDKVKVLLQKLPFVTVQKDVYLLHHNNNWNAQVYLKAAFW
jgi:hypothetical protein